VVALIYRPVVSFAAGAFCPDRRWWSRSRAEKICSSINRYIASSLAVKEVHVNVVGTESCYPAKKEAEAATPGSPSAAFV
jgi:hypothetical protein